jgi:catechol 2,3-dioxygenase-like lactoylglutathione lyase family enzyme
METRFPTFRITDYERSKSFYVDGLGFQLDGEQRRAPHLPRSMTISRDGLSLRLSEHPGCQFGALVDLFVADVDAVYSEFASRGISAEPSPERFQTSVKVFRVVDPDGNLLGICTRARS